MAALAVVLTNVGMVILLRFAVTSVVSIFPAFVSQMTWLIWVIAVGRREMESGNKKKTKKGNEERMFELCPVTCLSFIRAPGKRESQ